LFELSEFLCTKDDGSVVSWGREDNGGDSSLAADGLRKGVVQVVGNLRAIAATRSDGSVVSWGSADSGGEVSSMADTLIDGVVQVV
jgi:hypothetical protein